MKLVRWFKHLFGKFDNDEMCMCGHTYIYHYGVNGHCKSHDDGECECTFFMLAPEVKHEVHPT